MKHLLAPVLAVDVAPSTPDSSAGLVLTALVQWHAMRAAGALALAVSVAATVLPRPSHAAEGAIGRPIAGTGIQPGAGVVPDTPMLLGNITSVHFDGSIGGSARAPAGGDIALNLAAKISLTTATIVKVWGAGAGGWSFSSSFTLPYMSGRVRADLTAPGAALQQRDREQGLFDLFFTPVTAGYHFSATEHLSIGMGIWAPTGGYDPKRLANTGVNYWTFVPTLGYSLFKPASGVEVSLQGAVQFNTRNKDGDYHSAPLLTLDALIAKDIGSGWRAGVVAGWVQQLADDKGPLADRLGGFRGHSVALGPIVTYSTKLAGTRPVDMSLRWTPSVSSRNRMEGDAVTFTATAPF